MTIESDRRKALAMKDAGCTNIEISRALVMSESLVRKLTTVEDPPALGQRWRRTVVEEGVLAENEERSKILRTDDGRRIFGWPGENTRNVTWERI